MKISAHSRAFSLVEVMAAVVIIGIVVFLAIPNIVQIKTDSEENLARSRGEALSVAVSSLIQDRGRVQAAADWQSASGNQARFNLLRNYMAFPETNFNDYMPRGYSAPLTNVTLSPSYSGIVVFNPAGQRLN